MTPKEKAEELLKEFGSRGTPFNDAGIFVSEMIYEIEKYGEYDENGIEGIEYWEKVQEELDKMRTDKNTNNENEILYGTNDEEIKKLKEMWDTIAQDSISPTHTNKVILYEFENPNIKISIELYFNEENELIFDGYDIGKTVSEAWGDSDYEYQYTVKFEEVEIIAKLFDINADEKMNFLLEIKKRFSGNYAYSKFGAFMEENNIDYESFTWT